MKTVAYLINGGYTNYHIAYTGNDATPIPPATGAYPARICKHAMLINHVGRVSGYHHPGPRILRVSKLSRKRPDCISIDRPVGGPNRPSSDCILNVNGEHIRFYRASVDFIETLFAPGEKTIHLKIKGLD